MNLTDKRQFVKNWRIVLSILLLCTEAIWANLQWSYIPVNISVITESGKDYAVVSFSLPEVSDSAGVIVKQINGFASGTRVPIGEFQYDFSAEDSLGNIINCSFSVEVIDNEAPVISGCLSDLIVTPDSGICEKRVDFVLPASNDNSVFIDDEILPGDILFTGVRCDSPDTICFVTLKTLPSGTELHITDKGWLSAGGFRSGEGITTWKTNEIIEAGREIRIAGLNANTGECTGNALSLSASGDQLFIFTGVIPDEGNSGKLICGIQLNSSSGSTEDTWDGDAVSTVTSGKPSAIIPGFNGVKFSPERDNLRYDGIRDGNIRELQEAISNPENWATSNTGELKVSGEDFLIENPQLEQITGLSSGSNFPPGITVNKYEVSDYSGNRTECSFNIEVTDTTKPVFIGVNDIYTSTSSNGCYAQINYSLPVAFDICGSLSYETLDSPASGSNFPVGTTEIKVRVTDESGNSDTTQFNIIVEDKTPPWIQVPADITTMNGTGKGGVIVNYSLPVAQDNCSGVTLKQISGLGPGAEFPPGKTIETYRATDSQGNFTEASFSITVIENNAPSIECINEIRINEDEEFSATINFSDEDEKDILEVKYETDSLHIEIVDLQMFGNEMMFKIKPQADYFGETELKIFLSDNSNAPNSNDSCIVPVKVLPVNDPPEVMLNKNLILSEGEKITLPKDLFSVSDIDSPIESLKLRFEKISSYGKLYYEENQIAAGDSIEFTEYAKKDLIYLHNGNEEAGDTIGILILDESDKSEILKIPLEIKSVNDAPVLSKINEFVIKEDDTLQIDNSYFEKFITDPDNDFSDFTIELKGNENLIIEEKKFSNSFFILPKLNWFGSTKFLLKVNDGGSEVEQYVDLKIIPVNDPPRFLFLPEQIIFDHSSYAELDLYSMIEDVETENENLKFEFQKTDSIDYKFDRTEGEFIINSMPGYIGKSDLFITVIDPEGLNGKSKIEILVNNITDVKISDQIPLTFALYQNYPNPFNPVTQISYDVPEADKVKVKVLDILGREIEILIDAEHEAGRYTLKFNGENLSSGIYLVTMKSKAYFKVMKMLLIK